MTTCPLSPRELEVARLIAEFLTDEEIADILQISPWTVRAHVRHMALKLGAGGSPHRSRTVIARWLKGFETPEDAQAKDVA